MLSQGFLLKFAAEWKVVTRLRRFLLEKTGYRDRLDRSQR